jgi:hypothetical protein
LSVEEQNEIKDAYPQVISEAEPVSLG